MVARATIRKRGEVKVPVKSSSLSVGFFDSGAARIARWLEFGLAGRPTRPFMRLSVRRLRGKVRSDDHEEVGAQAVKVTQRAMDDLGIKGTGRLRAGVDWRSE